MKLAEIGNIVTWKENVRGHGEMELRGGVLNVLERTATVDLTVMPNWAELGLETRTSVKHGAYEIVEGESYTDRGLVSYKVLPGDVENYYTLRDLGKRDGEIQELWKKHDKEVNWHNARFYEWKKSNGLVGKKGRPKTTEEAVAEAFVQLDKQIVAEVKLEEVAQDVVETLQADGPTTVSQDLLEQIKYAPLEVIPKEPSTVTVSNDDALRGEIEALRFELEATRNELWTERTARLFTMQRELDALICESNSIQIADYDTEHILATIVELAEVAQEEQSFKYWKKNKTVDRIKLLEELADVLHFILSRGVQRGIKSITLQNKGHCRNKVSSQMLLLISLLVKYQNREDDSETLYHDTFKAFYDLTLMLDWQWHELVSAYEVKYSENIARQKRNY